MFLTLEMSATSLLWYVNISGIAISTNEMLIKIICSKGWK